LKPVGVVLAAKAPPERAIVASQATSASRPERPPGVFFALLTSGPCAIGRISVYQPKRVMYRKLAL
jgi:hypothetical protein